MSVQPSIEAFFGKRKRLITDNAYKSKLLKTDSKSVGVATGTTSTPSNVTGSSFFDKNASTNSDAPTVFHKEDNRPEFQAVNVNALNKCQEKETRPVYPLESPVKFQLLGSLSPLKKNSQKNHLPVNSVISNEGDVSEKPVLENDLPVTNLNFDENKKDYATEHIIKSANDLALKIKETRKKLNHENSKPKELSLKEIKDKINRSSKLSELKKSISKINKQAEELIELEKRKLTGTCPKVSKFKSFNVAVSVSPVKQQKSPCKPAYEKYAGLVESKTNALPLPFGFQKLYEFFCATDTICAMIVNRGETLTFNKLKPAVEEMTRKTFTTRYLGQIAAVYPEAFSFRQEKLKNYGSTSKVDRYELVIIPTITKNPVVSQPKSDAKNESEKEENVFRAAEKRVMTPAIVKTRKEIFYKNLLEKTKDHHEDFLKALDPPIVIDRNELKRWHPNFMVDFVPDITPQELPQPPNSEKPATAKEVLERAKEFLSSNVRLHRALEAAAEDGEGNKTSQKTEISPEIKAKVDARLKDPFKGISKSLLEKVRAKQAANAMNAMQMTAAQERETVIYMRLPDMARIVRTTFVNEQKGVLPLESLVEKVQFSCSKSLGLKEVESHIRLLAETLPEWISIITLRNLEFVKVNRNVDVTLVMTKLKKTVENAKLKGKCL